MQSEKLTFLGENMEFLERRSMAIEISDVYKSYGRGSRKTDVLRDFQMNIPRGHIYGLLGKTICTF